MDSQKRQNICGLQKILTEHFLLEQPGTFSVQHVRVIVIILRLSVDLVKQSTDQSVGRVGQSVGRSVGQSVSVCQSVG